MNGLRAKSLMRRRARKRKAKQLLRGGVSLQALSPFRPRTEGVPGVGTLAVVSTHSYVASASSSATPISHHLATDIRHLEESSVSKLDEAATPTSHHLATDIRHLEESSVSKLDEVDAATVARSSEDVSPISIRRSSLELLQKSSERVEQDSEILVVQREILQIQSQIEETVKEISKLLALLIEPIT